MRSEKSMFLVCCREPGNAGGLFLCCFELHKVASNTSVVYFGDNIGSRVQNCHKKTSTIKRKLGFAISALHQFRAFISREFVLVFLCDCEQLITELFFSCCFSKCELEDGIISHF